MTADVPATRAISEEAVEVACVAMHDAYEAAAIGAGWETQERSRKPWSEVPAANQQTMRVAVRALIDHLAQSSGRGADHALALEALDHLLSTSRYKFTPEFTTAQIMSIRDLLADEVTGR